MSTSSACHARGVPDTSAVIALPGLPDARQLPDVLLITTITLAELSIGALVAHSEAERAVRKTLVC